MNFFNIISEIEKVDPEFQDRISPRRAAIKNITSFGSKVAVAALPFAVSTLFKKAYGQTATVAVNDVLNYALKLEYLEAAFYNQGVAATALNIPSADKTYLTVAQGHENQHVAFLKGILGSAAVNPAAVYDFTAKGTFPTVFTNYDTFLAVAQALEDTGVRAYKGQAPNLLGNQTVLTAALAIHSVEARHASAVRQIRRSRGVNIKPWISGSATVANDTGISAVDGNYAGENNVNQGGVDITKLPAVSGTTSITAAIESFDEPLTMAQVVALVAPFGVS
jgi:hypothetical protein